MAGENPDDPRTGSHDEFLSKTKWQRFQVLIAGPLMNLVLSVVLAGRRADAGRRRARVSRSAAGHRQHREELTCGEGRFAIGDQIVIVAGTTVKTWEDVDIAIGSRPKREIVVSVLRAGHELGLRGHHRIAKADSKWAGSASSRRCIRGCGRSSPVQPAAEAGLKPNDIVLAVNGEPVSFARQLSDAIGKAGTHPIVLALERAGQSLEVTVTPRLDGKRRPHRHQHQQRSPPHRARLLRSDPDERAADVGDVRTDPADAVGPAQRRDIAEAADGTGRRSRSCPASPRRRAGSRCSR